MRIFREIDTLPRFRSAVVTIGTFDGVHKGHNFILDLQDKWKKKFEGESVLLTFWPHPRMVLQPDNNDLKLLNTIEEKIALLEKAGLDNLVIIPFTREFSKMNYLDFIRDILVAKLQTRVLIVGYDHHFGKNREGSYEQLVECAPVYNFELVRVEAAEENNIAISSTKIRKALEEGDVKKAAACLGYEYSITGEVMHGNERGRTIGYPTANVNIEAGYKLLPAIGVYAVKVKIGSKVYNGMANLGFRPTFNGSDKRLEVNIFDFNQNIYGEKITIFFIDKLRNELNFADLEQLKTRLHLDKIEATKVLT